ncbi:MAG: PEP-CTERM sorting domain-containing protein [Cyanobacteria bacterium P01_D01_bin.50]
MINITSRLLKTTFGALSLTLGFLINQNLPAQASSLIHTFNTPGNVGTIDTSTGVFTPVIIDAPQLTDIALSEDKQLFGATFRQLYSLDLETKTSTLIGNLGVNNLNGLGFGDNGVLYGTGGSNFYSIDTNSGLATQIADIPNFASAGDIVFNEERNQFFGTSNTPSNSTLFSIDLDGTATEIGNIGFPSIFGLFFENETLYGYTANRQQIVIDIDTGRGSFDKEVTGTSGTIGGATSLPSIASVSVPEPSTFLGLLGLSFGAVGLSFKRKLIV